MALSEKERTRVYHKEFGLIDTASLKKVKFEVNDAQAETDDVTITLPSATGTLATTTSSTGAPEFPDNTFRVQDNGDATKQLAFQCSGITTATTRTLTIPDASFTIPSPTGATFQDSTLTIYDNGDATKILAFQCSGITTATTRTLTVPDASGTIALIAKTASTVAPDVFPWAAAGTPVAYQFSLISSDSVGVVNFRIAANTAAFNAGAVIKYTGLVPSGYRPPVDLTIPAMTFDNNANVSAFCAVKANGDVFFYGSITGAGEFTAATCGHFAFVHSWSI